MGVGGGKDSCPGPPTRHLGILRPVYQVSRTMSGTESGVSDLLLSGLLIFLSGS